MNDDFDNARTDKEILQKIQQRQARNQRRNIRAKAARAVAGLESNMDWVRDRRAREEFACMTTLSLYRDKDLSTFDVGVISGVRRPRRALRRLERLGLVKSVSGWHRGRYQAQRGWQLAAVAPVTP